MEIEIRPMVSLKEIKAFVQFGIDLYDGDSSYCPPFVFDDINTLREDKNPAFEVCESIYYAAFNKGKMVGRIAGIINRQANSHWNVKKLRFGWFDFVDDLSVSKALLDAVVAWGKSKGMDTLNGPVGFSDMDHQGLLLQGYELLSPMAAMYNYPYYVKHYEAYGLSKEADWMELRLKVPGAVPEKMARVGEVVQDRYQVKIEKMHSTRQIIKRFGYSYFDLIDQAYSHLYNYSPLTKRQKQHYSRMYFPVLNFDFVTTITNKEGELIAVGICMPNITHALRKCKGKLFPFGWFGILKALKAKRLDEVDLLLIAVRPDYQNKGINALLFTDQIPYFIKYGVKHANVTAVWEENTKNQANWQYFEQEAQKWRRAYIKAI